MLYPDDSFHRVTDIGAGYLREKGIAYLALDVDNTLAISEHPAPADGVEDWLRSLAENGIQAVILSNNRPERVKPFAKRLGLPYVANGMKPLGRGFERCRRLFGCQKSEMALVGDQLLTDIWGARWYGVRAILVEPIELEDVWYFRCKRIIERILMRSWKQEGQKR